MKSCSIYKCIFSVLWAIHCICCYGCGTQVTIPTAKTFHFIAQTRDLKYFSQTCSTAGMVWVFTWLVVATGMGFHMTCSTCIDSRVTCSVAFYKASTTQVRQFSSTQYHGKFTMQHLSLYTFHAWWIHIFCHTVQILCETTEAYSTVHEGMQKYMLENKFFVISETS